jgi:hypothetical protein
MRSAPRAPASCGTGVGQVGGNGDALWRQVIDEVMVFVDGGRTAVDSGGQSVICQLGGKGKTVRRGPIDDEMTERVDLTE